MPCFRSPDFPRHPLRIPHLAPKLLSFHKYPGFRRFISERLRIRELVHGTICQSCWAIQAKDLLARFALRSERLASTPHNSRCLRTDDGKLVNPPGRLSPLEPAFLSAFCSLALGRSKRSRASAERRAPYNNSLPFEFVKNTFEPTPPNPRSAQRPKLQAHGFH